MKKLIKEIEDAYCFCYEFSVGRWYEFDDDYRDETYTFKVLGYAFIDGTIHVKYKSIKGKMEEIDPLEGYVGYFPSGCSFFNESVGIEQRS